MYANFESAMEDGITAARRPILLSRKIRGASIREPFNRHSRAWLPREDSRIPAPRRTKRSGFLARVRVKDPRAGMAGADEAGARKKIPGGKSNEAIADRGNT
jgi:hypothetical protein